MRSKWQLAPPYSYVINVPSRHIITFLFSIKTNLIERSKKKNLEKLNICADFHISLYTDLQTVWIQVVLERNNTSTISNSKWFVLLFMYTSHGRFQKLHAFYTLLLTNIAYKTNAQTYFSLLLLLLTYSPTI